MEQQLILDRYRPLEELGEGGFGSVVSAWDTRMQRRVAIKRLALPLDERGRPHRPHGLAEARTAAMLNHPGIVTVFDFDTDADEAFLVMEYVDGASLAELLDAADGPLTPDEAAVVFADVSAAIEFAHHNGVLHLDIKPANVLVTRDGRAKVADFGMAELSSLSGHGPAWGGTPGYMPVEQLTGAAVTSATDEWALAALIFEVLTGDNPFADKTAEAALQRLETTEPPLPSDYGLGLPPALDIVLMAGLGPRPEERYPDVTRFADALRPLLGDAEAGRESLAGLVEEYAGEDEDLTDDGMPVGLGLWDRMRGRLGAGLVRTGASVQAAWLAWAGLLPFGLEPLALAAAAGLVALAGALAPSLGIGLGIGCFLAGLLRAGLWPIALGLLLIGGTWWWFLARHDMSAAVLPLAGPILAFVRLAFAQPLLAGFTLPPLRAAITGLLGGALTMLASAASAQGSPWLAVWPGYALDVWNADLAYQGVRVLVTSPAALMALLGWPAAAAFMSYLSSRATRAGAALGALGGTALLGFSYVLAARVSSAVGGTGSEELGELLLGAQFGRGAYGETLFAVTLAGSLILMAIVIWLGPPVRAEEEEPFALADARAEDE